jgi:kynurenine formamidase
MGTDERLSQLFDLATARVYDLEQPRRMHAPTFPAHWPGHIFTLHRRHEPGSEERRTSASGMIFTAEHSGTHIDALCHQAEDLRMYGGVEVTSDVQTSTGFTELGVDSIGPIVKRGVLLDVAAAKGGELPPRYGITDEDLRGASSRQEVDIAAGSVVLVRTGYGAYWDDPDRYLEAPGVVRSGSEWLVEREVHAVGIDNVVWDLPGDPDPDIGFTLPGHVILLVRAGIYIVENVSLEELAADNACEFLFVCLPLKFQGGTGSPVRPIAIVPGLSREGAA